MKRTRLAIVGLGNLGRKCAEAIAADPAYELAGVVRHAGPPAERAPAYPIVAHISELARVDAALVCVPVDAVLPTASGILQNRVPIVECARLHGEGFLAHKAALHHSAQRERLPAIVGAGCDPGALSLFRSQFALLVPHGHSETSLHAGAALHRSLAAGGIPGVRRALATERGDAARGRQRYVYVELEPSADAAEVEQAIVADPLFLDSETLVFPVPNVAELEESHRGVLLERHAGPTAVDHASLLLEARYDETRLAARVMLAAVRALPQLAPGAHSLLDVPPGALWGEARVAAEKEWI
jgi:diaminopimelate dehydrogenase